MIETEATTVNGEVESFRNKLEKIKNTIESHKAQPNSLDNQQQLQERNISE